MQGVKDMGERLNIGLLVDDIDAVFTSPAVQGAELGAKAIDANLFIVPGRYLDNADEFQSDKKYGYQCNTLFDYVRSKHMDILYVMMGMIGARVDEESRLRFLKQFSGTPIVTLYTRTSGYPSIIFDNKCAFIEGITHIIRDHGARHIGYVSGPATNVDAMERLEAYREALESCGIPYNEDYVIYGNFEESSEGAIGEFIDRCPELDAMIFANDRMAYGGYHAFEKRGIKPGEDIAVLGFDNSEFAPGLNPPLSTVEANASELSYKAVIRAREFINNEVPADDFHVSTRLILRESCGCEGLNVKSVVKQTGLDEIKDVSFRDEAHRKICSYLFKDYIDSEEAAHIKENVIEFVDFLVDTCCSGQIALNEGSIEKKFSNLLSQETFRYTTLEQVVNMLTALQVILCEDVEPVKKSEIMQLFVELIRKMSLQNWKDIYNNNTGIGRITRLINNMTSNMFRMDSGERIPYENALENLSYVDIRSAYLFLYEEPIHHERLEKFVLPQKIQFKAYYADNKAVAVDTDRQETDSYDIFAVDMVPKDRRVTMVLSLIYSGTDIFGVLLCETGFEGFRNIDPVSVHISTAIKSMVLLQQQDRVQMRLEETMAKLVENNKVLQIMSKTDQLTGLLNRWGFLEAIQNVMETSARCEKGAFMCIDMDGLKKINDTYGHDDGDFALQSVSSILRHACGETALVARFGGDEFVVFGCEEACGSAEDALARIRMETNEFNKATEKPYEIDMSIGVCEVVCAPNVDVFQAISRADRLLYQEKRAKKLRARELEAARREIG